MVVAGNCVCAMNVGNLSVNETCPHCNKPVSASEWVCYRSHEDCWIDMLLAHSCISDKHGPKHRICLEKSEMKWLHIFDPG